MPLTPVIAKTMSSASACAWRRIDAPEYDLERSVDLLWGSDRRPCTLPLLLPVTGYWADSGPTTEKPAISRSKRKVRSASPVKPEMEIGISFPDSPSTMMGAAASKRAQRHIRDQ